MASPLKLGVVAIVSMPKIAKRVNPITHASVTSTKPSPNISATIKRGVAPNVRMMPVSSLRRRVCR